MQTHEYRTVVISGKPERERDGRLPQTDEMLGGLAAQGWRLVSVVTDPSAFGTRTIGYFERPVA